MNKPLLVYPMIPNRRLILPYAAPFLAYVLIASSLTELSSELNYALRVVASTGLLIWAWKWYPRLTGPKSVTGSIVAGVGAGVVGLLLWILLLSPFIPKVPNESWSTTAFTIRLLTAGFLVPIFEELLMRGFVLRLALQWDMARKAGTEEPLATVLDEQSVNDVAPGAWSYAAIIISTIAFASGHHIAEWPATVAFSILMSLLWILRKDLLSCIVAHGVTNITLAFYVLYTDSWFLW